MTVPKCLFFFQDLEGLTEVLAGCPQGCPAENFLFGLNFRSWFFLSPRSNKRCFLNGVFSEWCVQRVVRICKGRRHPNTWKQWCFQAFFLPPKEITSVASWGQKSGKHRLEPLVFLKSGKYPLGCSSMCWPSWFSGPGFCSCPGFHLGLGASDYSPALAFCLTGPWTLLGSATHSSPKTHAKTGRTAHVFTAQGGTRR